jgi:hypothetical protein
MGRIISWHLLVRRLPPFCDLVGEALEAFVG